MSEQQTREIHIGGNIDQALSGQYELKAAKVLNEAWLLTLRSFMSFTPTILLLLVIQVGIFLIALQLQLGDLSALMAMLNSGDMSNAANLIQSIYIANFSYEVVSAPIYAGVCLMAMSHAVGLKTKLIHISKGLQFTIAIMLMTLASLMIQAIAGSLFPLLSLYFTMAFSHAVLLICEKRQAPMKSLLLSLRAVNKKLLPITGIYLLILIMFFVAALFYGIGLIFVLPFFFHVKGILYREMFGIRLQVVSQAGGDNTPPPSDTNSNDQVFKA